MIKLDCPSGHLADFKQSHKYNGVTCSVKTTCLICNRELTAISRIIIHYFDDAIIGTDVANTIEDSFGEQIECIVFVKE